jgi:hypothetical protein
MDLKDSVASRLAASSSATSRVFLLWILTIAAFGAALFAPAIFGTVLERVSEFGQQLEVSSGHSG